MKKVVISLLAVVLIAGISGGILTACARSPEKATINLTIYATPEKPVIEGKEREGQQYITTDTGGLYTFKAGDEITIVVNTPHSWPQPVHNFDVLFIAEGIVRSMGILEVPANGQGRITIKLPQAGTIVIECQTYCGAWHSATGKMRVIPIIEIR